MTTGPAASSRPVALITGVSRSGRVGEATARALLDRGCDLILTYRGSDAEPRAIAGQLRQRDTPRTARITLESLDLANLNEVDAFARRIAATHPRLDILVHNASIYEPTPLASLTVADATRFYIINAAAPLLLSRGLAPLLTASTLPHGAAIIAMADIHAMGELGQPRKDFAPYGMSKAALLEMVLILARELAPRVRVNAVAPGVVAFPTSGHESDAPMQAKYLSRVPLARSGTPEEAAAAVTWLALDASYCTGQVIRVDGGRAIT